MVSAVVPLVRKPSDVTEKTPLASREEFEGEPAAQNGLSSWSRLEPPELKTVSSVSRPLAKMGAVGRPNGRDGRDCVELS